MSDYTTSVTTVGLNRKEQMTLDYIFKLSSRYHLVESNDRNAQLVLVNIDDPNAILSWKLHLNNGSQRAVIISEHSGRFGNAIYLSRRFLQRPCFAKQVLSRLEQVRLRPQCAHVPETLIKPQRFAVVRQWFDQLARFGNVLSQWAEPAPTNNPYYS